MMIQEMKGNSRWIALVVIAMVVGIVALQLLLAVNKFVQATQQSSPSWEKVWEQK